LCGFSYDVKEINNDINCKFKGKIDVRKFNKIQERIGKYKREQSIYADPIYYSPYMKDKKYINKINKIVAECEEIKRLYFYN
jgi:hypothetical protein